MMRFHRPPSKPSDSLQHILVGALGIEPSQPNGNGFTDRPPSLEEYAPNYNSTKYLVVSN